MEGTNGKERGNALIEREPSSKDVICQAGAEGKRDGSGGGGASTGSGEGNTKPWEGARRGVESAREGRARRAEGECEVGGEALELIDGNAEDVGEEGRKPGKIERLTHRAAAWGGMVDMAAGRGLDARSLIRILMFPVYLIPYLLPPPLPTLPLIPSLPFSYSFPPFALASFLCILPLTLPLRSPFPSRSPSLK